MSDTPRKPLLSDEGLDDLLPLSDEIDLGDCERTGKKVRDFYEDKITKGELMVVKTIPRSECKEHVLNCKEGMYEAMDTYFYNYIDHCPGCGAKITE